MNRTRVTALVLCLSAFAAACSDDSDGNGATSQPSATINTELPSDAPPQTDASTSVPAGEPGTITVQSSAITGRDGKMLLVYATSPTQGGQLAVACVPIVGDSFTVPATLLTDPPAGNPCAGGTGTKVFADGSYTVTGGIYTPGSQVAEAQTSATVEVAGGGAVVSLDGADLSS